MKRERAKPESRTHEAPFARSQLNYGAVNFIVRT